MRCACLLLLSTLALASPALAQEAAPKPFDFPADVQELTARVTLCSALVRSLMTEQNEEQANALYGINCVSDEELDAAIARVRDAHKDSPEIRMTLENLPPYKD